MQFERRLGYYIIQIYIPCVFLVMLSWLSFFMDSEDIANRLTLEVTMILAIVFLLTSSNSSMPRFSYAKASDVFMITSFASFLWFYFKVYSAINCPGREGENVM